MDNSRQLVHEQYTELGLDFPLQEVANEGDRIERRGDLERLERVISEDDGDSFLLREDQYDKAREFEIGEGDL